jgi:hypothetical protein
MAVDYPSQVPDTSPTFLVGGNQALNGGLGGPSRANVGAAGLAAIGAGDDVDLRAVAAAAAHAYTNPATPAVTSVPQALDTLINSQLYVGTTHLAHYGDANPVVIFTITGAQALDHIDLDVVEVWDGGGGPSITLGVLGDPARYFDSTESDLTELALFSKDFSELGPIQFLLTINPGSSPTTGQVRIQISTTPAGT